MSKYSEIFYSVDTLFHFTKKDTALEKILFDRSLKLNRCINTNDPREYQNWDPSIQMHLGLGSINIVNFDTLKKDAFNQFKNFKSNTKIACFARNLTERKNFRPACFKMRMWSQYGEDHAGACFMFSKNKLNKQLRKNNSGKVYSGNVVYKRTNLDYADLIMESMRLEEKDYVKKLFKQKYKEYFLTKHIDYRDEDEYRCLIIDDQPEDYFTNILTSLIGVIVGDRFPNIYYKLIQDICSDWGIKAYKLSVLNSRFNLKEILF